MSKTRKIVINTCYGGFGLSHAAVLAYAKRKGITLFCYIWDRTKHTRFVPYDPTDVFAFIHYSTAPLNKKGEIPSKNHFSANDIPRDDPHLIAVIKSLKKKAWARFAELKIVEIPYNAKWHIAEYDGIEHVAEDHRTWYA